MLVIFERRRERIVEDGDRLEEVDAVLLEVASGLCGIELEAQAAVAAWRNSNAAQGISLNETVDVGLR